MIRFLVRFAVAAGIVCTAGGCLVESTIDAKGGGTMVFTDRLGENSTVEQGKQALRSEHVEVTNAVEKGDRWVVYDLKFADVTKLSTSSRFKAWKFTRTEDKATGTTTLVGTMKNPKASNLPPYVVNYFNDEVKISVTAPGEIVKSNAKKKEGKIATWEYTINEFIGVKELTLDLVYKSAETAG
jgi:hypothetical protein